MRTINVSILVALFVLFVLSAAAICYRYVILQDFDYVLPEEEIVSEEEIAGEEAVLDDGSEESL